MLPLHCVQRYFPATAEPRESDVPRGDVGRWQALLRELSAELVELVLGAVENKLPS